MSIFLSVLLLTVVGILAAIAIANWQNGGLRNAWIAFGWGVAAFLVFGVGAALLYYYYIIKPAARAAQTQANVSEQMAKQNERTVNAAEKSARAAEDSATIARQVYEAEQQPQIYVIGCKFVGNFEAGRVPLIRIAFGNSGKKANNLRVPLAIAIRPRSFEGSLRDDLIPDTNPTQLEQNETTTIVPEYTFNLTEDQFKAIVGGESLLIFYGWVQYEDNRNLPHSFPICRTYNRAIFPDLGGCPEAIKVPEPKNK